jgi:2-dehydropantoate 2-reductase
MSVLIVGAGAGGGYIGEQLIAAGRDVTFLVHPGTLKRLTRDGLRVRVGADIQTIQVRAVAVDGLNGPYDVVLVAVRADAVESVILDIDGAVGPRTGIVPIVNGMQHLSLLTAAFGQDRVLGATARLAASLLPDGTIDVFAPGIHMELGQLDGGDSDALDNTVAELDVDNVAVTLRSDVISAMWEKFAFITAAAAVTCLVGEQIGPIAQADGGIDLARAILAEVASVAEAEGYPLAAKARAGLDAILTDPTSALGPSMFRDLHANRPVEVGVLADLAALARDHRIGTPLVDASIVVIDVHNRRIGAP